MPNMYEEYLTFYKTYTAKFGSKVAIFLMVGMFYEMYDERSPEGTTKTTVQEVVDLLGLAVSVKKGEGPTGPEYDGIVAGVPDQCIHKWSARLTQQGWTVVLVGQVKNAAGKVTKRQVERILTPGSHIESASLNSHDMYLTFVAIQSTSEAPYLALTAVDLTTGSLHVFETQASGTEDAWTSNDVVQFMELYPPREVLWSVEGPKYLTQGLTEQKLRSLLSLNQSTTAFHQRSPLNSGAWLKPAFREEYLKSRCSLKSLLPTHVALHLAAGSRAETALLSLLNALEELWPSMNLGPLLVYPWIPSHSMRLGENALVQLHMIHETKQRLDVLSLFDSCATPMGHRGIRERLLKPSADPSGIQGKLDAVEAWVKKPAEYSESIYKRMRAICDIDRVYRKIQQGTITATELVGLDISFKAINYIARAEKDPISELNQAISSAVFNVFDITKIYNSNEDISVFVSGQVPALDVLESQIQAQMAKITEWIGERARSGNVSADTFRIEFRERSLVIKAPRGVVQGLKMAGKLPATTTAVMNKTSSYLESTELDQIYAIVGRLRESLKAGQSSALVEKGTALANTQFTDWIRLTDWITQADVNLTLARVATDLGYVKPVIEDESDEPHASLHIEGLRHPLLEAQDRKIPYVQHTVTLDKGGWLLYGLNASGKSSLMRATGLAVLLAQAGSFVPATKMVLRPFQSIHTRIINTDNLWMGLSSFAVEMSEMRDIFRDAGPRSLVLGDELCSGTETTSATALVAAGIKGLLNRKAKFLFATHLHGLSQIQEVSGDPRLKIWHLHVEYDRISDKLIYHRSLKPGSGSSLYGLEVAKAMRIPADILEDAVKFRRRLAGEAELSESVGSAWNQNIIRRKCQGCGVVEQVGELEVHHIRERHQANAAGRLADGVSVHSAANLIVLCEACHDETHRENLVIRPAIQTSDGVEEATTVATPMSVSPSSVRGGKSKWSEEELATIKSVMREYHRLKDTVMSEYLLTTHEIVISAASLKKMRQQD